MKEVLFKLLLSLVAILAPVHSVMAAAMVLVVCDLTTGIAASLRRKEKISSAKLKRTIVKLIVYEIAIVLGFIVETHLTGGTLPIINIIGCYIGLTELVSTYENIDSISGGKLLKAIIDKLNSTRKDD